MTGYDDIIDLPHHVSETHPQMPLADRAAQFSPFAALTGYDAAIEETARTTEEQMELDEGSKLELNDKLQIIADHLTERPQVSIRYFVPDKKKSGGTYVNATGIVKKIDGYKRIILLTDSQAIPVERIVKIDGDIFAAYFA